MNRLGGHVVLKFHPVPAAVKGSINSKLCPDKKKVGILRMFSDNIYWLIRKIRGDGSPGFPIVSRLIKKWSEVVLSEACIGNISYTWLIIGSSYPAYPVAWVSFNIFIEFGPVFPAVSGHPDIAVICSNPEQTFHQRRFINCGYGAVLDIAIASLSCSQELRIISSKVGAYYLPVFSPERRFDQFIAAMINDIAVVRGNQNRSTPVPAHFRVLPAVGD